MKHINSAIKTLCLISGFFYLQSSADSVFPSNKDQVIHILNQMIADSSLRGDRQAIVSSLIDGREFFNKTDSTLDDVDKKVLDVLHTFLTYCTTLVEKKHIAAEDHEFIHRAISFIDQMVMWLETIHHDTETGSFRNIKDFKAPRESGSSPSAHNAIVGNACCDLTQVLTQLSSIKKAIAR